jgi:hypothetical protein
VSTKGTHVIVDGSNLATEGRTLPSLSQLEDAVASYQEENPQVELVVVVDATFEHRVETKLERDRFKAAEAEGKMVTPPAGAVGRGDAFILKIAQKMNAVVLSNDSFQEFHGEYPWLFDLGRLIGGKPVPGVGWIFTPRTPVRGPKSREATKKAALPAGPIKKLALARPDGSKARIGDTFTPKALVPEPIRVLQLAKELGIESKDVLAFAVKAKVEAKSYQSMLDPKGADKIRDVQLASLKIKVSDLAKNLDAKAAELVALAKAASLEVVGSSSKISPAEVALLTKALEKSRQPKPVPAAKASQPSKRTRTARAASEPREELMPRAQAVANKPIDFVTFLATHKVGSTLSALVTGFTSHGASASVDLGGERIFACYVPTARLGDPPPRRARDVLTKGVSYRFKLAEVDVARRVAELSLAPAKVVEKAPAKPAAKQANEKAPAKPAAKPAAKKAGKAVTKRATAPTAKKAGKAVTKRSTAPIAKKTTKPTTKTPKAAKAPATKKRG